MSALEMVVLPAALAFLWELSATLAGVRLTHILGIRGDAGKDGPETSALTILAANIFVSAGVASAFSFLKVNSFRSYCAAMVVMFVASSFGSRWWRRGMAIVRRGFECREECRHRWTGWVLAAAFVPAFLLALRPVIEVDSLSHLNFMLDWLSNRTTPYVFASSYVAFWELAYMPVLALTRSDTFFWLVSVKPVLVVGLGLYALGLALRLPGRVALTATAAAIGLEHFWWGPSGIPTLKNDMLHAAGFVLLALAVAKSAHEPISRVHVFLLTAGLIFAGVKYSGPAIGMAAVTLLVLVNREHLPPLRNTLAWSGVGAACALLSVGPYYLRNILVYHNVFYPVEIHLFGFTLPGTTDLSGTTILSTLNDPRLWRSFFLPDRLFSPAGILFPLTLSAALAVSLLLVGGGAYRWARGRAFPRLYPALAALVLCGWLSYFGSYYSASAVPGDLVYVVRELASLRYAEGVLGVSEVFLLALLHAGGLSEPWLLLFAAVNLASRLLILVQKIPASTVFTTSQALLMSVACALVLLAGMSLPRRLRAISLTGSLLVGVFVAGPLIVELNRGAWAPWWTDAVTSLREAPPATVFMLVEPRGSRYSDHRYMVAGRRFQHNVRAGSEVELASPVAGLGEKPTFVVKLRNPNLPPDRDDLAAVGARLASYGYDVRMAGEYALLLQRVRRPAGMPAGRMAGAGVWVVEAWKPLMPGVVADTGARRATTRGLRAGDLVLSGMPPKLYRLGAQELELVALKEGDTVTVVNGGSPDPRSARGLTYSFDKGEWAPDLGGVERANADHDFRLARARDSLGPWEVSAFATDGYRIQHLSDESGLFLRVTATRAGRWLVIFGRLPRTLAGAPVTARAEARCHGPSKYSLDLYEFLSADRYEHDQHIGAPCGDWETLRVWRRIRGGSDRDYYALGLIEPKQGDSFDVRELSLLKGFVP